jgi:hypothetical protein
VVETVEAVETGQPAEPAESVVWAVDPESTWWDEVWPFVDETEPSPEVIDAPVPEPAHEPVEEETPVVHPTPAPTPVTAWESPRRSRRWVAAVLAAVVIAAADVWLATGWHGGDRAQLTRSDTFDAPVRLAPDTSWVRSRVLRSGDLVVTHWIRSSRAVRTVTIRTPHVVGLAPDAVHVEQVVLATDGLLSPVEGQPRGTDQVTYRIPATHRLYVRYQLSGALQRSGPAGRALARITSADVEIGSSLAETTRTVVGARVLSLACSSARPGAVAVPCGSDHRGRWSVRLGRSDGASRVMAQLDVS